MFSERFLAFNREAHFTRDLLAAGATEIRKANYASKGTYFHAFTALATGLERIGKLCLIVDSWMPNDAASKMQPVRTFGHDINSLYLATKHIVTTRSIKLDFLDNLDGDLHQSVLLCLTSFASGDRYANIDFLTGRSGANDSIAMWANQVDSLIADRLVSRKRKELIDERAGVISAVLGANSTVLHARKRVRLSRNSRLRAA